MAVAKKKIKNSLNDLIKSNLLEEVAGELLGQVVENVAGEVGSVSHHLAHVLGEPCDQFFDEFLKK